MSRVRVSWDDEEQTIIRYDFDYGWTWAELELANQEFSKLINTVSYEVCSIAFQNYTAQYIPPNPIAHIGAMLPSKNERKILSILVIRSSLVMSIIRLVMKLYPAADNLKIVSSEAEARAIVRRYFSQRKAV